MSASIQNVDFLLLGQGIAGTMLAHFLLKKGKTIAIVDNSHQKASAMVAAGVVNPITGRNYLKTWLADQSIPFAKQTYAEIQALAGHQRAFWIETQVVWVLENPKMINDWQANATLPDLRPYVNLETGIPTELLQACLWDSLDTVGLHQSGRIDLIDFLATTKTYLQNHPQVTYLEENFDWAAFSHDPAPKYKNIQAQKMVSCEGHLCKQNPYFGYLPFWATKGEALIVKIPDYPLSEHIIKHKGLLILPFGEGIYWVGANHIRSFEDDAPTLAEKETLIKELQKMLKLPFEVVGHWAGIRPTVKDRKPYLGAHPNHPNMFIFNGLGSKGSYLAPYFADLLAEHLCNNTPLPKDITVARVRL